MQNNNYSKPLLNSIEKAFAANNRVKNLVINPQVQPAALLPVVQTATRALNNVKRAATTRENLNKILNKIYSTRGISNASSINNKLNAYLELRGNSKLSTNIGIGSIKYKNLLNALKKKKNNNTQADRTFAQEVGSRISQIPPPPPARPPSIMSIKDLIEAARNTPNQSRKNALLDEMIKRKNRLPAWNQNDRSNLNTAIAVLKPRNFSGS